MDMFLSAIIAIAYTTGCLIVHMLQIMSKEEAIAKIVVADPLILY